MRVDEKIQQDNWNKKRDDLLAMIEAARKKPFRSGDTYFMRQRRAGQLCEEVKHAHRAESLTEMRAVEEEVKRFDRTGR